MHLSKEIAIYNKKETWGEPFTIFRGGLQSGLIFACLRSGFRPAEAGILDIISLISR